MIAYCPGPIEFAREAGIWVSDLNEVRYTSNTADPRFFSMLDMKTLKISKPKHFLQRGLNPLGGEYFNDQVYFTSQGNESDSDAPSIYSIDPVTFATSVVLDSYYGVIYNQIDDASWVKANTSAHSTS
jgi:gluconolactonase